MRRLESQHHFWEAWTDGPVLLTRFGSKKDENPRVARRILATRPDAEAAMDAAIRHRTSRGMEEVDIVLEPVRDADLEARLHADPEDLETWRVYADWLQEGGNEPVWGALIAAELARMASEGRSDAQWQHCIALREQAYGEAARLELFPSLHPTFNDDLDRAELHCGFIRRFVGQQIDEPWTAWRFVRSIVCVPKSDTLQGLQRLEKIAPVGLRSITMSPDWQERTMLAWMSSTHVSWFRAVPNLEVLSLAGRSISLVDVDAPRLRRLALMGLHLFDTTVRAIATGTLPRLEDLELWMGGHHGMDVGCDASDIGVLLATAPTPEHLGALRHLRLRNAAFTDALIPYLVTSPLLPQLETLDLSDGTLTTAGVHQLIAHAPRFAHLQLDLSGNVISGGAELEAALPNAIFDAQREYDPDNILELYAAVVE